MTATPRYLGIRPGDLADKPYSEFWNPQVAPLPDHAREAVAHGPIAAPLLPALADAPAALQSPERGVENGFCFAKGGALHIAIHTFMPQVTPAMIDWWFGWHSDEPQRYKLWHPRAHVYAAWVGKPPADSQGRARYVGRTSHVDEYIGSSLGSYHIRFLAPHELGLDEHPLRDAQATAVCARVGFASLPIDIGYLLHNVTPVAGGSEMRSRFWIGGPHASARRGGLVGKLAVEAVKRVMRPTAADASALLVHCSQEMSHLATFLPTLFAKVTGGK